MTYTAKYKPEVIEKHITRCNATILRDMLKTSKESYKNWTLRAIFSVVLISYFCFTIYTGPGAIMSTTLAIQIKCFSEIINIGYEHNSVTGWLRYIPWYFLIVVNYFFCGETLSEYYGLFLKKSYYLWMLVKYHRFISFCLYFSGLMLFVMSLVKKYDIQQFSLLTWTHLALLLIVGQSHMIVKNIFEGLIWLIIPVSLVACNDITSFLFGKFLGKTPLTQLSPKKTWEGFVGGGFCTIICGILISSLLCKYPHFVCPIEYVDNNGAVDMSTNCTPSALFQLKNYELSFGFYDLFAFHSTLQMYPFVFHSLFLSVFSSIIAPFGGIFASGFKRAFKIKDFGNTIPGHGGILDRFDCHYLMTTFVNVYISSFIRPVGPERIFSRVLAMDCKKQIIFHNLLQEILSTQGLLNNTNFINPHK